MTKIRAKLLVIAIAGIALPANTVPPTLPVAEPAVLTDVELAAQRGGFAWSGMTINFGAEMRTYIGEELVLETILTWTDKGAETRQTAAPSLDQASAAELEAGILSRGNLEITMGGSRVFLANEGRTAIIHRTDGPIGSVLINTGNNVDARTEVTAQLDISGFESFRGDVMRDQLAIGLGDMVGLAGSGQLGR